MAAEHAMDGALGHLASVLALVCAVAAQAMPVPPGHGTRRTLARLGVVFAVVAVGLHLVHAVLTFTDRLDLDAVGEVLVGAAWTRSATVFGAGAILASLAAGGARPWPFRAGVTMGVVGLTWLGHGTADGDLSTRAVLHAAHIGAAVTWAGGLLGLMLALAAGARPADAFRDFSKLAAGCVGVLAVTGVLLAARYVPSPPELASAYGGALGLKLCFVFAAVGAAARNRARLGRAAWGPLLEGLEVEVAAVCAVLALASTLAQIEPPGP